MEKDVNVSISDAQDEGDLPLDLPNAMQVAHDRRHGQPPPDLAGPFPVNVSGSPQGSQPPDLT